MIITGTRVRGGRYYGGTSSVTTDTYFNLVTLLLPGTGTNGAQNNTFLDSSTNNFTVTRNGNTTQGTFSPFSQTGWSNYFDGTDDYLNVGTITALGSGDFTISAWVYPQKISVGVFHVGGLPSSVTGVAVFLSGGGEGWGLYAKNTQAVSNTGSITLNKWYYITVIRSGTTTTLYVDGVSAVTISSDSTNYTQTSLAIGGFYSTSYLMLGYISNFRIVSSALTATVPTAPFTAVSGTSLLTCQSNRFVDNSANAFAITVNGNTSVQAFSPFNPTAAYSAAAVGGSGYFDGTGDYLSVASNAALGVGSGNFTVECWIYLTQNFDATGQGIITAAYDTNFALIGANTGAGNKIDFYVVNTILTTGTNYISLNTWTHIAAVRSSGTTKIYFDGVEKASSGSLTGTGAAAALYIGTLSHTLTQEMTGYISSARLVKGSAVYTSAFTPPTAPLTAIANTSLLLNFTNAGITDATAKNVLETVGGAAISTAQSKFGGSSMYFDGSGDYLVAPAQAITNLIGDFTVEFWVYRPFSGNNFFYTTGDDFLSSGISIYIGNSGNNLRVYNANGVVIDAALSGISFPTSTWTHIALVRSSGVVKLFVAGSQAGSNWSSSTTFSGKIYLAAEFYNGSASGNGNCYLQDFRITIGLARYTTTFTPPTQAFPTQ